MFQTTLPIDSIPTSILFHYTLQ